MHFRFPTSRYTSPIKQKYNPSHIICPRLSKDASKHEKNVNEMGSFFCASFALLLRQESRDGRAALPPPAGPCPPQGGKCGTKAVSSARRITRYRGPCPPHGGKHGTWAASSALRKIRYAGRVLRKAENTVRGLCPPQGGKYGTRAVSAARRKTRYAGRVTSKNCRTLDGCGSFFQNLQVLDPVR